ncbi:unnamed protein product [Leptidea sinapis]|uniref:ZAD domain-containing protein n=1 Tax=Leptidea sinapis TaxID=189913 RepID=A0A5E4QRI9_9NEOP|nr:unnamed protein product [Leptidea sinapis]
MSMQVENTEICEGCLSTDRKLTTIEQYYDLFLKIINEGTQIISTSKRLVMPHMCWECVAVLQNIHKFREKFKQANDYLNISN